jgi:hypothetical protein
LLLVLYGVDKLLPLALQSIKKWEKRPPPPSACCHRSPF